MALPRISDKVHTGQMKGRKITLGEMLDQDFALVAFNTREGSQGEYACVQACGLTDDLEPDDARPFWFLTGAKSIMDALRLIGDNLPVIASIGQVTSKAGRKVYTIA